MTVTEVALTLDLKGLSCPLPIVKTAKAIKELKSGDLVEVQGTAEGEPFSREQLDRLVDLASAGILELTEFQRRVLSV